MDSDYLVTDLDFLVVNGVTFTTEERAMLHNSLTLLKEEGKFRKVYFWGKLLGLQKNYYVSYGLHRDILRQKQTFYSQDMKRWNLLTPPLAIQNKLNKYIRKPLIGDPAYEETVIIPVYTMNTNEGIEAEESVESEESAAEEFEDEEIENEHVKKNTTVKSRADLEAADELEFEEDVEKVLTDEERLSCIVQQIDFDSALAPRGAYVRTPIGEVLANRFFIGLDLTEAAKPHNYMHVRFPKDDIAKKTRINNSEVARTIDFLDNIADDDPKGCWSIQIDSTRDVSILRNLWWPGMVFYHRVCSRDFGFVYVGYGEKNVDLPFML